jgi:hypothetical protein
MKFTIYDLRFTICQLVQEHGQLCPPDELELADLAVRAPRFRAI